MAIFSEVRPTEKKCVKDGYLALSNKNSNCARLCGNVSYSWVLRLIWSICSAFFYVDLFILISLIGVVLSNGTRLSVSRIYPADQQQN